MSTTDLPKIPAPRPDGEGRGGGEPASIDPALPPARPAPGARADPRIEVPSRNERLYRILAARGRRTASRPSLAFLSK